MSMCRSESIDQIQSNPPPVGQRATLLILAFAVLVASLGSGLRFVRCLTGCCAPSISAGADTMDVMARGHVTRIRVTSGEMARVMMVSAGGEQEECCCCSATACSTGDHEGWQRDGGDGDPDDRDRGNCGQDGDCCVEISFDMDEAVASSPLEDPVSLVLPLVFADNGSALHSIGARQFICAPKRGPPPPALPRIDRGTALRACTVLLI